MEKPYIMSCVIGKARKMASTAELTDIEPQAQAARRSTMEVLCDILEVVSGGMERPTHIIYRANISWRVLNNCLRTLMAKGLVVKANDGKRDVYQLTDNGYSVLALYRDLRARLTDSEQVAADEIFARDF